MRGTTIGLMVMGVLAGGATSAVPATAAPRRADLTVRAVTRVPSTRRPGQGFSLRATVADKGKAKAKPSVLGFLLSRNARADRKDLAFAAVKKVKALRPGRSAKLKVALKVPAAATAGVWRVLACADRRRKVRERSEANNCRGAPGVLTIPLAPVFQNPATPASPAPLPPAGPGATPTPTPSPGATPTPTPAPTTTPTPTPTPPPTGGTPTPLEPGAVTSLADATAFIYQGAGAPQQGVAANAISPKRIAVLRGEVDDAAGAPLAGVKITVLGHPEYGSTSTRADGGFDMAVNGSRLQLVYAKDGYVTVERLLDAPWQDYLTADTVAMTPLSAKVSAIDPGSDAPLQAATGSAPAGGANPSTLLFPAHDAATAHMPDGTTKPLAGPLSVRVTEFPAGPQSLPGTMTGTVGPTYAAEFTIDQAAGATSVSFAKPVIDYTDNFIGAPVGTNVPTSSYDRVQGRWVPEKNGRVIEIADIVDGKAVLNGATGLSISDDELAELASRFEKGDQLWRVLITHFTPWDHNWPYGPPPGAVPPPLKEFEWKDPNDPCNRKSSTIACEAQTVAEDIPLTGTSVGLNYVTGRQPGYKAGESFDIPVTPSTLPPRLKGVWLQVDVAGRHYEKKWCDPGYPTTGARTCSGLAPLVADTDYHLEWDGKDAYGRPVQGRPLATVTETYVYEFNYYGSEDDFDASFGQFPTSTADVFNGAPYCASENPWPGGDSQHFFCGILARRQIKRHVGTWEARDVDSLGGATLSIHHAYDPQDGVVYKGDGTTIRSDALGDVLKVMAGGGSGFPTSVAKPGTDANLDFLSDIAVGPDGSIAGYSGLNQSRIWRHDPDGALRQVGGPTCENGEDGCTLSGHPTGDGGPALGAVLGNAVKDVAIGPDGSIYFTALDKSDTAAGSSSVTGYIRRIAPDGKLSTIAGAKWVSSTTPEGDGGPATEAHIDDPVDVAVGPDGSVYFSERPGSLNHNKAVVRKITTTGLITRVAGGGTDNAADDQDLGAGEPALDQDLRNVWGIAVAPDGTLYLADPSSKRVQKVGPDGILTRIAGNGTAKLDYGTKLGGIGSPVRVDLAPDGSVYVRTNADDTTNNPGSPVRIVRIGRDGDVTPIAGLEGEPTGCTSCLKHDGEAAQTTIINSNSNGLGVLPDGTVVYTDGRVQVLRIQPALPGFQTGATIVPSQDGSEAYVFDSSGRHLETRDGLTGALRWKFSYDDKSSLAGATDGDGNAITIQRAADGTPTAIVAPGGQTTALAVDGEGRLASATNPAGEKTALGYWPGGLVKTFTRPGARTSSYAYDTLGRVTQATSATGRVQRFARTETTDSTEVKVTSGAGRDTTFRTEALAGGDRKRVITNPDGTATTLLVHPDATRELTAADGTVTSQTAGPDPRWGMRAPIPVDEQTTTPSGKTLHVKVSRSATLASAGDPFSNPTMTTSVTKLDAGGAEEGTQTTTYDRAARTLTVESPEGRTRTTELDAKGRVHSVTAAEGKTPLVLAYDGAGRVASAAQGAQSTTYAYDGGGRLATRTDAGGGGVRYAYDAADRVTSETFPGNRTYAYAYKPGDGRLDSITAPRGGASHFAIDGDGAVTGFTPPATATGYARTLDGDGALTHEAFPTGRARTTTYDAATGLESATDWGAEHDTLAYTAGDARPATVTRDGQGLALAWDGFLPASSAFSGPADGAFAYTAGPDLKLAKTTLTAGAETRETVFGYDDDGLATAAGPLTFTRDGAGQAGTAGDGTLSGIYGHDGSGRLNRRTLAAGGSTPYDLRLTYDDRGRVHTEQETIGGAATTRTFAYDDAGELTGVTGGGAAEAYAYDDDGNRSSRRIGAAAPETATYDTADRLLSRGGTAYSFDDDGFLAHRGGDDFTYSPSGDLLSAKVGAATVTYAYDATGRRTARTAGGATEQYLYGNPGNPFQLTASRAGGVLTSYLYDDDGALVGYERGGERFYVGTDQDGTPKVVFKADGTVLATMAYDAFGRPAGATGAADLPIGFGGGLGDPLTGLVRLGLRDYDPAAGRFVARDPTLFSGSPFNLYAYAGSDPVGRTDPTGLWCSGFSFYAAIGGGITICSKNGKTSVCSEFGVGAGGGVSIDPLGDAASNGATLHAELTESFGPLSATVGGDLDLDCFNTKGFAQVGTAYGGLSAGVDTDGNVTGTAAGLSRGDANGIGTRAVAEGETATRSSKWGFGTSGKVAINACGQF